MSVLNQNNKSLSRLAIISKHVAADKRKRFGTVWVDFCQEDFSSFIPDSFFGTCLFPLKMTPHCEPLFSSSLFTSRVNDVVLVSGCFDANGGCSVGGASCLMSSKCLAVAERCLVPLTGDEEWGGGLAEKGCPGWLTSRCVWELPWAQKIVWENALM